MKANTKQTIVVSGAAISLFLVLMFVAVLLMERFHISIPLIGPTVGLLTFFGSPFAFVLTVYSTWAAHQLTARLWVKVCLTLVNVIGAVVSGMYTFMFIALFWIGFIRH